jgi:YesN/AraC family two-component response regulator
MDHRYTTSVTLAQLADITRLSPNYLCVAFRRVVGKTPIQYLNDLRVQHACRLLEASRLNVAEVAASVGISDANYFARLFKQKTGLQPRDYVRHQPG